MSLKIHLVTIINVCAYDIKENKQIWQIKSIFIKFTQKITLTTWWISVWWGTFTILCTLELEL